MLTPNSVSLEDLERAACAAHASAIKSVGEMLEHAMRAGDILIDILNRKLVGHGDKKALFERTCGSQRVGQLYIQIAENRPLIEAAKAKYDSQLTITDALRLIRKTKSKNSSNPDKPPKSLSGWTGDELSTALTKLGPERLLQVAAPAFRQQLATRFAGQQSKLITQIAADNPKLKAKDLPPFIDARREAQARAMQDVGVDFTAETYRLQVSLDDNSRELQRLKEKNDRLETILEEPAKLIAELERIVPRSNREAHKHLQALKIAVDQPLIITGTGEAVSLH